MESKKKNNTIAIIVIFVVLTLAILAGKWIVDFTNDAYSYNTEFVDEIAKKSKEIDEQTEDFKKRAEEAKQKYEDAMKYLE